MKLRRQKNLAYLFYYESDKRFYIELPADADEWETPLILSSFVKKGEKTINSYWSKVWVKQRIVPSDRQNIAQVLKDNGLSEYDEFALLMLSKGRCAQDTYYLKQLRDEELPSDIVMRFERRLEGAIPIDSKRVLAFFQTAGFEFGRSSGIYGMLPPVY